MFINVNMLHVCFDIYFQINKSLLKIRAYQLEADIDNSEVLNWQISDSKCKHMC